MNQEYMKILNQMAAEAVRELDAIRHPSAGARAKNLAKSLIGRGSANISDPIFWPAGLLLTGLMETGHTGSPDLRKYSSSVEEYLAGWLRQDAPVRNPDDALTGSVVLELYAQTGNPAYKEAADKIAAYLKGCLRDANGSIIYGQQSGNSRIYADGTGMTAMFLARYSRILGAENQENAKAAGSSPETSERYDPMSDARIQLLNYARYGMDVRSGLPYHAYDTENGLKLGIIGWGRAVGWLLLGLSEYLICNPDDEELADFSQTILNAVSDRVRPDGMLSWQLDCMEGPLDTSATGMIFYAMLRMNRALPSIPDTSLSDFTASASLPAKAPHACPEQSGVPWIDSSLLDAAALALRECVTEDGKVYWCSAECIDIAQYSQQFGHYSWGQAAVLAFLALYESCPT